MVKFSLSAAFAAIACAVFVSNDPQYASVHYAATAGMVLLYASSMMPFNILGKVEHLSRLFASICLAGVFVSYSFFGLEPLSGMGEYTLTGSIALNIAFIIYSAYMVITRDTEQGDKPKSPETVKATYYRVAISCVASALLAFGAISLAGLPLAPLVILNWLLFALSIAGMVAITNQEIIGSLPGLVIFAVVSALSIVFFALASLTLVAMLYVPLAINGVWRVIDSISKEKSAA